MVRRRASLQGFYMPLGEAGNVTLLVEEFPEANLEIRRYKRPFCVQQDTIIKMKIQK